ncbi:MAG: DMT family transporter [Pseudomonadota bacterium]
MDSARQAPVLPRAGFLFLAAITLFWGLNWPGMKIILAEIPVWWFRSSCLWFGGLALLSLAALGGHRCKPRLEEIPPIVLVTLFNVCGWHLCSAYGVSLIPAGRAAIIAFTMPLWASLFSVWLLRESFSLNKLFGLSLGMAGLLVLIGTDLIVLKSAPLGSLFMLGAALSWALGTVLFKRGGWDLPIASCVGWQLLLGAVPLTTGAMLLEPMPEFSEVSLKAWIALAYLFVFPMTFCQWAYLKVVHLFPASIAAIGTLLVPVVGVYSSALLLGEVVGWSELVSLLLTCGGLLVVLVLPSVRRKSVEVLGG